MAGLVEPTNRSTTYIAKAHLCLRAKWISTWPRSFDGRDGSWVARYEYATRLDLLLPANQDERCGSDCTFENVDRRLRAYVTQRGGKRRY